MKLKLIVHQALNLANKDMIGKSDPYVVVAYGDKKFKSKSVKSNLNPIWDHTVELDLNDKSADKIKISVFDDDIGKDDLMGNVEIDVEDIKKLKTAKNSKVDLTNCKSGQIILSYELNPKKDVPVTILATEVKVQDDKQKTTKDDVKDKQPEKSDLPPSPKKSEEVIVKHPVPAEGKTKEDKAVPSDKITDVKVPMAEEMKLKLIVHKALNLANKDMIGKSDPYVVVAYGDKKFKSKSVKSNLNPIWDHTVELDLNDKSADKIKISVFDDDIGKDDLMGNVEIDVEDIKKLKTAKNSKVDLTNCKSGQIILSYELNPKKDVPVTIPATEEKVQDDKQKTTKDDVKDKQPEKSDLPPS